MTKLRGENHKYKDLMFVLSRQVETQNKMRDHNSVQVEILNNALNTIVSEKDNSDAWVKLVNEVDVHRLQSI
jgi:predicted membrane chloride channel (bestrophin family)